MSEDVRYQLPIPDLTLILGECREEFLQLHRMSILVTGGTGFVGKWLLESILYACKALEIQPIIYVLSRDPQKFTDECPQFSDKIFKYIKGDITRFDFPGERLDLIVHAATETDASHYRKNPRAMLDTAIDGTKNILRIAKLTSASRVLFTSSGAVYGKTAGFSPAFTEDSPCGLSTMDVGSVYGEAKRVSELLGAIASRNDKFDFLIARLFAFVGPHLPLNEHFAIGNFIRDGIGHNKITVNGDGTAIRSYMYAADLTIWLIHILTQGRSCSPYNVGSPDPVSIGELANTIGKMCGKNVEVLGTQVSDAVVEKYLPSTAKAEDELGLRHITSLEAAISKTISWYNPSQ